MLYSKVKLSELNSYEELDHAILEIEKDYQNYYGGLKQWNSGYETVLKDSAKKKIQQINNKIDKLLEKDGLL